MRRALFSLIVFVVLWTFADFRQTFAATAVAPGGTPTPGASSTPSALAGCVRETLYSPQAIRACFVRNGNAPPSDTQIAQLLYCVYQNNREFGNAVPYCIGQLGLETPATPSPVPSPTLAPTATPTPTNAVSPSARRTPKPLPTSKPLPSPTATPSAVAGVGATPSSSATPRPRPRRLARRSPTPVPASPSTSSQLTPIPNVTQTPSSTFWHRHGSTPFLFAGGGAALIIISVFFPRLRRKRSPRSTGVRIMSPGDLTIQVCNRNVIFTAQTIPPGRESEIRWEVPLDQSQTASSGSGAVFTTSWTETGVKQVVARFGDTADDLIVYAFKTTGGGTTRDDILGSAPPLTHRSAREYTWYRSHAIPAEHLESN